MVTKTEKLVNILLHVLILFTILSVIFWLVISKVESKGITDELNNNINKYLDTFKDDSDMKTFSNNFSEPLDVLENMYSDPDEVTESNNAWLFKANILYILILVVIIVSILLTMRYTCGIKDFPILHILKENMVIFLFIGIVEVWFFLNIGMKFIPTKPSMIVNNVKTNLSSKL